MWRKANVGAQWGCAGPLVRRRAQERNSAYFWCFGGKKMGQRAQKRCAGLFFLSCKFSLHRPSKFHVLAWIIVLVLEPEPHVLHSMVLPTTGGRALGSMYSLLLVFKE